MESGTICLALLFYIDSLRIAIIIELDYNKRMGLFVVFHMNVFAMLKSLAELLNYLLHMFYYTITQTVYEPSLSFNYLLQYVLKKVMTLTKNLNLKPGHVTKNFFSSRSLFSPFLLSSSLPLFFHPFLTFHLCFFFFSPPAPFLISP